MRRSFFGGSMGSGAGGGGGVGGGGGGINGGNGMLRAVHRAARAGVGGAAQEPFSHSTTSTSGKRPKRTKLNNRANNENSSALYLSSSTSSPFSTTLITAAALSPTWDSSSYTDESEDWECLDHEDNNNNNILFDDINSILGPVPSTDEVHHAVSAIQQVLKPSYFSYYAKDGLGYNSNEETTDELTSSINLKCEVSSSGSASDWIEPSMHICNSKLLQSYGSNRVYDAFHLLQTEPSIQKMVISLSSDKAVWDAVLNNEAVREIRDSLRQADSSLPSSKEGLEKSGGSDETVGIIDWVFVNTKEKVMEIVDKIIEFVSEWFPARETPDKNTDQFGEKVQTSFFLAVLVFLVVVVARAK